MCQNYITHSPQKRVGIPFPYANDRLAHAFAHLWQSLLKNYTYHSNGIICENQNGRQSLPPPIFMYDVFLKVRHYGDEVPLVYPVVVEDAVNSLRLVTCGRRGLSSLPFYDLVSTYEVPVWCTILVVSLILIGFRIHIHGIIGGSRQIFSVVKVLLEQGNPILASTLDLPWYRLIAITFMLAGIVISNAYKNTNIFNMVTSRNVILYKRLDELIQDQFKIFTDAAVVIMNPSNVRYGRAVGQMKESQHTIFLFENESLFLQEIFAAGQIYSGVFNLRKMKAMRNRRTIDWYGNQKALLTKVPLTLIDNYTNLHPDLGRYFKTILHGQIDKFLFRWAYQTKDTNWNSELRRNITIALWEKQEDLLYGSLRKCDKTSLLLPNYKALNIANKLKRQRIGYVSVGEEMLGNISIAFEINGVIGPYLVRRLHGLEMGGFWNWWIGFIKGQSDLNVISSWRSQDLVAPTMKGNILVIFVVLFIGLAGGCITFLVETKGGNIPRLVDDFIYAITEILKIMKIYIEKLK